VRRGAVLPVDDDGAFDLHVACSVPEAAEALERFLESDAELGRVKDKPAAALFGHRLRCALGSPTSTEVPPLTRTLVDIRAGDLATAARLALGPNLDSAAAKDGHLLRATVAALSFFCSAGRAKGIDASHTCPAFFEAAITVAVETRYAPYLSDLSVDDVPVGDGAIQVLAETLGNWLRSFSARRAGLSARAVVFVCRIRRLRSLHLDGNSLGDAAVELLGSGALPLLTDLGLQGVDLDLSNPEFAERAGLVDGSLERLRCGENTLSKRRSAAQHLAALVCACMDAGHLTELDLSGVALLGDSGAEAIAAVLAEQEHVPAASSSSGFKLRLNNCEIGRVGFEALVEASQAPSPSRGARFHELSLDGNFLDGAALQWLSQRRATTSPQSSGEKRGLDLRDLELEVEEEG